MEDWLSRLSIVKLHFKLPDLDLVVVGEENVVRLQVPRDKVIRNLANSISPQPKSTTCSLCLFMLDWVSELVFPIWGSACKINLWGKVSSPWSSPDETWLSLHPQTPCAPTWSTRCTSCPWWSCSGFSTAPPCRSTWRCWWALSSSPSLQDGKKLFVQRSSSSSC